MRSAFLVALVLAFASVAFGDTTKRAPEVKQVLAWIKETTTAPTSADAKTAATLRHEVIARGWGCKTKNVGSVTKAAKKEYVACLGKFFETANLADDWDVRALDQLPKYLAPAAKFLGKTNLFVLGSYSDGFILIALGAATKGSSERPIAGIHIDMTGAE